MCAVSHDLCAIFFFIYLSESRLVMTLQVTQLLRMHYGGALGILRRESIKFAVRETLFAPIQEGFVAAVQVGAGLERGLNIQGRN